jgi:NAD(P)-dependent dehydrogenase (short-subunit alcohol dehydrogenase family)
MRLNGKIAVVVGGGQQPGETIGNGRATCLRFAEEGATVLVVDQNLAAAKETVAIMKKWLGLFAAEYHREADCKSTSIVRCAGHRHPHNNAGRCARRAHRARSRCGTNQAMNLRGMF